jgi:hypothetical protein
MISIFVKCKVQVQSHQDMSHSGKLLCLTLSCFLISNLWDDRGHEKHSAWSLTLGWNSGGRASYWRSTRNPYWTVPVLHPTISSTAAVQTAVSVRDNIHDTFTTEDRHPCKRSRCTRQLHEAGHTPKPTRGALRKSSTWRGAAQG